ncbi:MAG TPA: helix-turn-helix domain-containing protein [Solirubrobacterales bacterium]|nr:helix-turn-helix domain-containing protein [Solirubrobacterales bacterium]
MYAAGLRDAVAAAVDYGLDGIEKGGDLPAAIPPEAVLQARRAARGGIRLDTVLRRYAAGNKALEGFIVMAAEGMPSSVLGQILSDQGPRLDRLMVLVSAAYRAELERTRRSSAQKRADQVAHLLKSSSLVGPADLGYDFDLWHVGMIVVGDRAERTARAIGERCGQRSLPVVQDQDITWIWIGSTQQPVFAKLERYLTESTPAQISIAIGEPRRGLEGWRQTHHEAQVALQVMLCRPQRVTRCRDVILISAVMRDQSLAMSLIETYLAPLDGRGDSGQVLRRTLREYFNADQNAVSAAAALGVARHTVERRLRSVEERLGQTLDTCGPQMQVALGAEELVAFGQTQHVSRP